MKTTHQPAFAGEICGFDFGRMQHLKKHILRVHEGIRPYECENCDAKFSEKSSLVKHMEEEKRYKIEKFVENDTLVVQITSRRPLKA